MMMKKCREIFMMLALVIAMMGLGFGTQKAWAAEISLTSETTIVPTDANKSTKAENEYQTLDTLNGKTVCPIELKAGCNVITLANVHTYGTTKTTSSFSIFSLLNDATDYANSGNASSSPIASGTVSGSNSQSAAKKQFQVNVENSATYYIVVDNKIWVSTDNEWNNTTNKFEEKQVFKTKGYTRISAIYYPLGYNDTISLNANSKTKFYSAVRLGKQEQATYYKIEAKKDGLLTVTLKGFDVNGTNYNYNVQVANIGKKLAYKYFDQITPDANGNAKYTVAVKKGAFFLAVYAPSLKNESSLYPIHASFQFKEAGVSAGGNAKAKAVNIKRGKTFVGMTYKNNTDGQWFKFNNPSEKLVTLSIANKNTNDYGKLTFTLISKSTGKKMTIDLKSNTAKKYNLYTKYSTRKLAKGIYYIKVTPSYGNSGKFTIKWN